MQRTRRSNGRLPPTFQTRSRSASGRPADFDGKERHTTVGADPTFLTTAAYEERPGIGTVFDWKTTNLENARIARERDEQMKAQQVEAAYAVTVQSALNGEAAHQKWLSQKAEENRAREALMRRVLQARSIARSRASSASSSTRELCDREQRWVANFSPRCEPGGLSAGRERGDSACASAASTISATAMEATADGSTQGSESPAPRPHTRGSASTGRRRPNTTMSAARNPSVALSMYL